LKRASEIIVNRENVQSRPQVVPPSVWPGCGRSAARLTLPRVRRSMRKSRACAARADKPRSLGKSPFPSKLSEPHCHVEAPTVALHLAWQALSRAVEHSPRRPSRRARIEKVVAAAAKLPEHLIQERLGCAALDERRDAITLASAGLLASGTAMVNGASTVKGRLQVTRRLQRRSSTTGSS